ncbi:hypothetical protein K502DRAFT_365947 [Neoconidiobolus thromboides FSU 785]|nr:hypothetical protein K502DRAFT_365947 [Neoconidiobolus thromboides FSU 785]
MSHKVPQIFQDLVNRVMTTFYEPKFIIVMSLLNRLDWISEDVLIRKLVMPAKEVQNICSRLKDDGFIHVIKRKETKGLGNKTIEKTYYAVDYPRFINVTKWKIAVINESIKNRMDQKHHQPGYYCPVCNKVYDMIELAFSNRESMGDFRCEVETCNKAILIMGTVKESQWSPQETLVMFKKQTEKILALLKETEKVEVVLTKETLTQAMVKKEQAQKRAANGEIAFAQDTGGNITKITVVLAENDKASKEELEAELEKKRQQNAMPIWFVKSTIRPRVNQFNLNGMKRNLKPEMGSGSAIAVKKINTQLEDEKKRIEKQQKEELKRFNFYKEYYQNLIK